MAKNFVIIFISIILLFFIAGCTEEPAEKITTDTNEPKITEPVEASLPEPEPIAAEEPEPVTEEEPVKVETKQIHQAFFLYEEYASLLKEYVDKTGMVNYTKLKRKRNDIKEILRNFAKLDQKEYQSWSNNDKIAFWINVYNIQTMNIILNNYPIESARVMRVIWPPTSIRHIDRAIGEIKKQKFIIMDEEFTLEEIQKRFLQNELDEPRTLLAINHASLSSPPLLNEPYYGHKLDQQLEAQVKKFLASERAFAIDRENEVVYLSAIFQNSWHGLQFSNKYATDKKFKSYEPSERAVLNFISKYVSRKDASFLELESYDIKYIRYDWRLNDNSRD